MAHDDAEGLPRGGGPRLVACQRGRARARTRACPASLLPAAAPGARFLSDDERATLRLLASVLIPADERSGGAAAARVDEYIDLVLGHAEPSLQGRWRVGLARHAGMSGAEAEALLREAARAEFDPVTDDQEFFVLLKSAVVEGFYTSAEGIAKGAGLPGDVLRARFPRVPAREPPAPGRFPGGAPATEVKPMPVRKSPRVFDVAVVGSGAAGGMTAHVLTGHGLEVAMLEAGPRRPLTDLPIHRLRRWQLPSRGLRGDYFREWLDLTGFLADDTKEPYGSSGDPFEWVRVRAVGGKSLFWAGVTPRFGPDEFQPRDDFDTRWPLTYDDVAPWYDRVEEHIGVTSTVRAVGRFPLNKGLPPLQPKCAERELGRAAEKLGRGLQMIPIPKAILTRAHRDRPPCHHCGPCWLGCDSGSKFDALRVFVAAAERTGRLRLYSGARVRSVALDPEGRARSVHYYDVADRTWREVKARVVVLAAGAIESAQILLNSRLANSSGLVGRYLSEHLYGAVGGHLPQLMGRAVVNEDGNGAHAFIPDLAERWRGNRFLRGYQIYPTGGIRRRPWWARSCPASAPNGRRRCATTTPRASPCSSRARCFPTGTTASRWTRPSPTTRASPACASTTRGTTTSAPCSPT